jgi:hypothetical protein
MLRHHRTIYVAISPSYEVDIELILETLFPCSRTILLQRPAEQRDECDGPK